MSVGFQSGRSDDHALESFAYPLISPVLSDQRGEFCLRIKARGSAITSPPDWIQLQMFAVPHPHRFEHYSLGGHYSIVNPAESDNEDMLSVGAAAVSNTSQIWDDSSRGPMVDGTLKPDIVGAHLVNSVTYGNLPFAGTSQAAPHVGGLAALVVQALTNQLGRQPEPTRVAGFLKRHAIDRGTRGPDNTWGSGFAYLPTLTPAPTPTPTPTPTPPPRPAVCLPVSNYAAARLWPTIDYISWQNPTGGLRPEGRSSDIRKWIGDANGDWRKERIINAQDSATHSFHVGIDADAYYAYRTRSRCVSGKISGWTNWVITGPSGEGRGASDDGPRSPTPTPVPADYVPPRGRPRPRRFPPTTFLPAAATLTTGRPRSSPRRPTWRRRAARARSP